MVESNNRAVRFLIARPEKDPHHNAKKEERKEKKTAAAAKNAGMKLYECLCAGEENEMKKRGIIMWYIQHLREKW
jgi:hypothetical protein